MILNSCYTKGTNEFEANHSISKLNPRFEKIVNLYIKTNPKLNHKEYALEISVLNIDSHKYYVRLNNGKKSQYGYDENQIKYWSICEIKGFTVFILDKKEKISKITKDKLSFNFLKSREDIIPNMYNGNPWEFEIHNDTIENYRFINEHIKKEIQQKINI